LQPGTQITLSSAGIDEREMSRAVLREATRLLEFFGVIMVRRGNEGGIYVTTPDPAQILTFARIYFNALGVDPKHVSDLREHLNATAVKLCAAKLSTAGLLELRQLVDQLGDASEGESRARIARGIWRLIFRYSGNRAVLLFGGILHGLAGSDRGKAAGRIRRPGPIGDGSTEAVAQLSTAFLKSNEREMIEALNALRASISTLS
jgi:DNA-binding FadR family transcriptional regulator